MLLGEILIRKGLITKAQLDSALEEQKASRQFLGSILLRKNFIKIKALVGALSEAGRPVFLGELLLNKGLLSQFQLDLALDEQKRTKEFLGVILIRRKYISETDFLKTLSQQFNMPFISLKDRYIDWDLAMSFPASLVLDRKCMPVFIEKGVWIIAVTNPLNAEAISEVEAVLSGQNMKLALVSESDMAEVHATYKKRIALKISKLLDDKKE